MNQEGIAGCKRYYRNIMFEQERHCVYNVTLFHIHVTIFAMEMQQHAPFLLLLT